MVLLKYVSFTKYHRGIKDFDVGVRREWEGTHPSAICT